MAHVHHNFKHMGTGEDLNIVQSFGLSLMTFSTYQLIYKCKRRDVEPRSPCKVCANLITARTLTEAPRFAQSFALSDDLLLDWIDMAVHSHCGPSCLSALCQWGHHHLLSNQELSGNITYP